MSSVTVKVMSSPSLADASAIVTAGLSSSRIVPVAAALVPRYGKLTLSVKVSSGSATVSPVVATVKVCVSPAVPAKLMAAVFSV